MRECLGWLTNCENRQGCPQNWLELAVSEIPTEVHCQVCGSNVALVLSEEEVRAKAAEQRIAAFPVVPCAGMGGTAPAAKPAMPAMPSGPPPGGERKARHEARAEPNEQKAWVCMLQNGDAVKLDKDTMIVGRSRTCDIVIPSAKVSRQHASVTRSNDGVYIEDLGSANGVWRGAEKITRVKINSGDVFTISDETLTFELR